MKYFTPELIAAANNWIEQSEEDWRQAEAHFWATVETYNQQLEALKSRISQPAWHFFRYGFGRLGLHDATLLSLCIGDALGSKVDVNSPFRLKKRQASAHVELLNYEQDLHYTFDLRGLKRVRSDLFVDADSHPYRNEIGDLFTYELTDAETGDIQLGLLFTSGASIVFQFEKLIFRKRRIKT